MMKPPDIDKLKAKKDIKGLIKALKFGEDADDIQMRVAEALGNIGYTRAGVRRKAADALGEISDARAVEPLILALKDKEQLVHESVAKALGKIGGTSAVEPLIAALKDEDDYMRKGAAKVLGEIGDARAVEPLIANLQDEDMWVRESVAEALCKFNDTRVVEPLIAVLKDRNYLLVHEIAVAALGKIGDTRAVETLIAVLNGEGWTCALEAIVKIGKPAVTPLIAAIKDDSSGSSVWNQKATGSTIRALEAIVEIGEPAVEPLISSLKDESSYVRQKVTEALDKIGWQPEPGENDIYYYIAKKQWDKCSKMGSQAVEPLIAALQDKDLSVRESAAKVLGEIGDARAVEPLIANLQDKVAYGRKFAAEALGKIGDARAVEPLIAILKEDTVNEVRLSAAEALDKLGWKPKPREDEAYYYIAKQQWDKCIELGEKAIEPLLETLKDRDSDVSKKVNEALVKIGWQPGTRENEIYYYIEKQQWDKCIEMGAKAVEPLIAALKYYGSKVIRRNIVEVLGKIGDARAVEPLIAALKDQPGILKDVAEALGKIGDARAAEPLVSKLVGLASESRDFEDTTINAIIKIGKPAVKPLIQALNYGIQAGGTNWMLIRNDKVIADEMRVHMVAAGVLAKIGKPAVESLISALRDKEPLIRLYAAEVLGKIGDATAIEPLTAALIDENSVVRKNAQEALNKIRKT